MKKFACVLLLTSGVAGCFSTQPETSSQKPWIPTKIAPEAGSVKDKDQPQRLVSAEQVTPNNARQMADALLQEMDRAN